MSTRNNQPAVIPPIPVSNTIWQRRFFITLTILGWAVLAAIMLWILGKIITPIVLIGFSALLAYLIFPLIRFFGRHMPRVLAILVSLLILLAVMGFVIYFVAVAAVQQLGLLIGVIRSFIEHPQKYPQFEALLNEMGKLGLSKDQVHVSGQQILSSLEGTISGVVPIISSIFIGFLSLLLIATLAVYFIVDGPRLTNWCRHKTPLKYRRFSNTLLDELDHSLGGFVRGQVLLATIMAIVMGIGAFIIGVPYVFLLVVIVFICEFIPQIGAYISGAIGIGFALTHGWQPALIYAIYASLMQAGLDGQVLSPRILGRAVGLHPITSVFALLVGLSLFGLLGALFACPAAAILQTFVRTFWDTWHERHPDQFPEEEQEQKPVEVVGHEEHGQPATNM